MCKKNECMSQCRRKKKAHNKSKQIVAIIQTNTWAYIQQIPSDAMEFFIGNKFNDNNILMHLDLLLCISGRFSIIISLNEWNEMRNKLIATSRKI